ncbi:MAG: FecR family protein [Rectinemataceae bacterium]|jgi:hypothetical protein
MKRITPLVLIAVSLVLFFTVGCAPKKAAPAAQASMAAPVPRGMVVFFEGDVKIDGTAAEIGRALGAKTLIETGSGASCDIVFDGKNALRVSQNAVAALDFSGIVKEVTLKKGGLTSVLRKLDKIAGTDSFRVVTPIAIAGVRGTSFCVWVDDKSTYVCACNGTVKTIDAKGSNELVLSAAHHTARNYLMKGETIGLSTAGVEHHSDAGMESLAARIGEKIDWSKED